jgi:hypothetical protein
MLAYTQYRAAARRRVAARDIAEQVAEYFEPVVLHGITGEPVEFTRWGPYNKYDGDPFDPYWDEEAWWEEAVGGK